MQASCVLLVLCIFFHASTYATDQEEELPALELLGFIADFSDDEEGWVDPQEIEELFNLQEQTTETVEEETVKSNKQAGGYSPKGSKQADDLAKSHD